MSNQKLESHVVSLEIAQELVEAGWKKETEFRWYQQYDKEWKLRHKAVVKEGWVYQSIPAPLATEILEELPYEINADLPHWLKIEKEDTSYIVSYSDENSDDLIFYQEELLATLAKMWLYLKKENLL